MSYIDFKESSNLTWEKVTEGVDKKILRSMPGEKRVLLRIAAGKAYPKHAHDVPDEVFVLEGTYVDPDVEGGKEFGPGSYLYYSAGTVHKATSPNGCTIMVWNNS